MTAIEFGKEERERVAELHRQEEYASSEYQAKVNTAKNNGFDSPEEMADAAAFVQEAKKQGKSLTELHADLTKNSNIELPEETVPNPDLRRKGVLERSQNAPPKESVQRERMIQIGISDVKIQAKAYLLPKYKNNCQELFCQCCQKVMPFKLKSGEYYFEAVQKSS